MPTGKFKPSISGSEVLPFAHISAGVIFKTRSTKIAIVYNKMTQLATPCNIYKGGKTALIHR